MRFSQYIYTSWNNGDSPDKGFMVYGKSDDVSTAEAGEILNVMRYKPHRSLPDMPSLFEIEKDFPKNFAVFPLYSGRTCIAQAAYVGKDYVKEDNPRFGNYIIHALLVNADDGVRLQNLLRLPLFKSRLTPAEQDAPAGPHLLDKIAMTEDELLGGNASRIPTDDSFWAMVQAVLLATPQGKNVYVTTEQKEVEDWVKALIDLLPTSVAGKLTLSTYLLNKNPLLTLNFIHRESPTFRPGEEVMNPDSYVIHTFVPQYNTQIPQGRYVTALRERLKAHGVAAAVEYRVKIEEWMRLFSLSDVDAATELEDFFSENSRFCRDSENIHRILDCYARAEESLCHRICNQAASILDRYGNGYGEALYPLYRRVYPYLPAFVRPVVYERIGMYLLNTSADANQLQNALAEYTQVFGADSQAAMEALLWQMLDQPKVKQMAEDYCRQNFSTLSHPDLARRYRADVKEQLLQTIRSGNLAQLESQMKEFASVCEAGRHPLEALLPDLQGAACWANQPVAFYLLEMASDRLPVYVQCFENILEHNDVTSAELIVKLEKSRQRAACVRGYRLEESIGERYPEYIAGCKRLQALETATHSRTQLCHFYHDYVAYSSSGEEEMAAQFHRLLQVFLNQIHPEKRSREAIAIFEFISTLEGARPYTADLIRILYRNAFDRVTLDQLIQWKIEEKTVDEMNAQAAELAIPSAPIALLYQDYCYFKEYVARIKNRADDLQGVLRQTDWYYRNPHCPVHLRQDFMVRSLPLIMQCIAGTVAPEHYPRALPYMIACFAEDRTFANAYLDYLQALPSFGAAQLILLAYCAESDQPFAHSLNDAVLIPYLKRLGKNGREELFAYWLKHSGNPSAVEAYRKYYQENHRSFWERLFS
jgi:hypothetical protein